MDNIIICGNCGDMATHYDREWLCEPCYDESMEIERELDNIDKSNPNWLREFLNI